MIALTLAPIGQTMAAFIAGLLVGVILLAAALSNFKE